MLDLSQQYGVFADTIRKEIEDALTSQRFILGSKGAAFEEAMADLLREISRDAQRFIVNAMVEFFG